LLNRFVSNLAPAKRLPILLRWAVFLTIFLALACPREAVLAHPVDMYAQEQLITLTQDGISIQWKITPGPLLADSVWAAVDADRNDVISPPEAQAWLAPFLAQLSLTLDGQALIPNVGQIHWPAAIGVFRTGEDAIQIQLDAQWPAKTNGVRHLQIHNAYLEANSLNWFSLTAKGLSFTTPAQNNGQLTFDLSPTAPLTSWNSGQPDLAGMALNFANQDASSGGSAATSALVGLVRAQELSPLFLLTALLLSLALGSLHALTPGHGKALVAAYLVGSRGRSRDAVFLGLVVTLTHTGSVILLGLLTLLASQYILPGLIAPWLEIASGVLVIVFGLNLFFQRRQVFTDWWAKRTKHKQFSLQTASVRQPAPAFGLLQHAAEKHPHQHGPGGHTHLPTGDVTWKSLLALGISGGLVPCPDAIAILLVAVAINRILFGMLLIVAFSVGLALVLILIGIAMVQGLRLVARNDWLNRFSRYTPLVSALVVSGLGLGLTVNAVNTLKFTSAAAQPVSASASLLYLLPDSQGKLQLTRQPLTGGAAIPLTTEPDGLAGYALSPDHTSILYLVFDENAQTTMHLVHADGTEARLLLDCKDAQCGAPVWSPDGRRLIYQRAEPAGENGLPRFSLWWLDVSNAETRPVFQDGTFASYAAAFSPDGVWLSYKSPANNTLQLHRLKDAHAISIPIPAQSGASPVWNPVGDALLFWDAAGAALHVVRYELKSGKKTDLGGAPDQNDYAAAWSPDGAWLVIDRELPATAQRKRGDEVWLVQPDGREGHIVLDEDDASYSDVLWTADGKSLIYTRYSYQNVGKSEIWQVELATGAKHRLAAGGMEPSLLP
jgi:nickel/cobalt exporter